MKTIPPHQTTKPVSTLQARLRKLALFGAGALAFLYLAGVIAGYVWLRHGRKIDGVKVTDVAFFQVGAVRRAIGAQHYVRARAEAAEKNYQAAYLSFASALRQDPDNIPGRIDAAAFFRSAGAANQSLAVLEEGLARQPGDVRLIEATFDYLLSAGRAGYALELLRQRYGKGFSGESAPRLRIYEIRATLITQGVTAARELLQRHPELRNYPAVAPVMARIFWESAERVKAIGLMRQHTETAEAGYEDHALLVSWLSEARQPEEAIRAAERTCAVFPKSPAARALLIEVRAATSPTGGPSLADITSYLKDFADQPETVSTLAATAGRKGWLTLARALYETAAVSQADLGFLALHYADALARNSRFAEFNDLLTELEGQASDNGSLPFMLQLRLRQVIAAGALRNSDSVRESARRLASLVRNEPDRLESFRLFFQKTGLPEAVMELGPRASAAKPLPVQAKAGG